MLRKILIIGHPLAAEENRRPFKNTEYLEYFFCVPNKWKARTLGIEYEGSSDTRSDERCRYLKVFMPWKKVFFVWMGLRQLFKNIKFPCFSILRKLLPMPFVKIQEYVYHVSNSALAVTERVKERLLYSGKQPAIRAVRQSRFVKSRYTAEVVRKQFEKIFMELNAV